MFDVIFHIVYVKYLTVAPQILSVRGDTEIAWYNCDLQVFMQHSGMGRFLVSVEQCSSVDFYLL